MKAGRNLEVVIPAKAGIEPRKRWIAAVVERTQDDGAKTNRPLETHRTGVIAGFVLVLASACL
jgi:hypothetical protein